MEGRLMDIGQPLIRQVGGNQQISDCSLLLWAMKGFIRPYGTLWYLLFGIPTLSNELLCY